MWIYQHKHFAVHQLAALSDNYIYLIAPHNSSANSPLLIAVDPAEADPVVAACEQLGRPLTHILNTHHHWDHTGANLELKETYGCTIIGNAADAARIPGIDQALNPGDGLAGEDLRLGDLKISVLDVPGHTLGHIAYVIDDALFCGDTLFGAGCGRLFEGTPEQMWHSLSRLALLADDSRVYCAHEYTLANLAFAVAMDPDNAALKSRLTHDQKTRQQGKPTIPSTIGMEKASNPFLRPADQAFCAAYAQAHGIDADALSVFTHLRACKDRW